MNVNRSGRGRCGAPKMLCKEADKALKHLEWVKNSGRKDFIEYGFALGELRRLQR